jgi:phage shock protein PspC (stress-responsive transcriptional regulator)
MKKKILKKSKDKKIAGICSGIADYLGWQTHNVRTIFVIAAIFGSGLVAYLVLYFVMPDADADKFRPLNIDDLRS